MGSIFAAVPAPAGPRRWLRPARRTAGPNFALAITAAAATLAGLPVLAGATVVAAIFFGLVNAWVLLVEILR